MSAAPKPGSGDKKAKKGGKEAANAELPPDADLTEEELESLRIARKKYARVCVCFFFFFFLCVCVCVCVCVERYGLERSLSALIHMCWCPTSFLLLKREMESRELADVAAMYGEEGDKRVSIDEFQPATKVPCLFFCLLCQMTATTFSFSTHRHTRAHFSFLADGP